MIRVTNNLLSNNLLNNVSRHKAVIDNLQNKISSGNRIIQPHEDPTGTAMAMSYRSKITEYQRYSNNINDGISRLSFVDVKFQEVKTYLDQIRERAVAAANGTYNPSDMLIMGNEVEQFLHQIVLVANAKLRGESVFSGYDTEKDPYEITTNKNPHYGTPVITNVAYKGDVGIHFREIDRGEYIEVNVPGNRVFWASDQRIQSQTPGTGYVADRDQVIKIDGIPVNIKLGDNLETIVNKINNANISVKAEIDNTTGNNLLVLQSTVPHQLWLEDDQGSTVLQDLGILAKGGAYPPGNLAPSAIVQGDSIFDKVIALRDAMMSGDVNNVNKALGGIDQCINNLMNFNAEVGARQKRMEVVQERVSNTIFYAKDAFSKVQGLDMAEAVTNLKFLEFQHTAALQIGARIIPPTLLDYLR